MKEIFIYGIIVIIVFFSLIVFVWTMKKHINKINSLKDMPIIFSDEQYKKFNELHNKIERDRVTPKIIDQPIEKTINEGADLLKKEGFKIPPIVNI